MKIVRRLDQEIPKPSPQSSNLIHSNPMSELCPCGGGRGGGGCPGSRGGCSVRATAPALRRLGMACNDNDPSWTPHLDGTGDREINPPAGGRWWGRGSQGFDTVEGGGRGQRGPSVPTGRPGFWDSTTYPTDVHVGTVRPQPPGPGRSDRLSDAKDLEPSPQPLPPQPSCKKNAFWTGKKTYGNWRTVGAYGKLAHGILRGYPGLCDQMGHGSRKTWDCSPPPKRSPPCEGRSLVHGHPHLSESTNCQNKKKNSQFSNEEYSFTILGRNLAKKRRP